VVAPLGDPLRVALLVGCHTARHEHDPDDCLGWSLLLPVCQWCHKSTTSVLPDEQIERHGAVCVRFDYDNASFRRELHGQLITRKKKKRMQQEAEVMNRGRRGLGVRNTKRAAKMMYPRCPEV
jgi:hypothetical protein